MNDTTEDCGFATVIKVIGGKWKVEILCALDAAPRRFGRLRQSISGISEKMLAQQLREMEADGIIDRRAYAESPAKVVYSLTNHGAELGARVATLCDWGKLHQSHAHAVDIGAGPEGFSQFAGSPSR